jgi:TPP-dependent pyruvate/acetoin dehydrogenase alpha subunit
MKKRATDGAAAAEAPKEKPAFSLISNEKLLELYSTMVKCRMLAERMRELVKHDALAGNFEAAPGREAAVVGVAIDLVRGDAISPSQHHIVTSFVKGASLERIFRQLSARAVSSSKHESAAAQLSKAIELAGKLKKSGKVSVMFAGDDLAAPDLWQKALKTAGARRLPIIFVLLDKPWAKPPSSERHAIVEDIALKAQACGLPAITVDINDVVAVYRVACEAIVRARKGGGPTLIECQPYLLLSQPEIAGAESRHRSPAQIQKEHDPILNIERYLAGKGLYNAAMKRKLKAGIKIDLDAATKLLNY